MPLICGVTFRGNNKVYQFSVDPSLELHVDDQVIVDTSRGDEMARVVQTAQEMEREQVPGDLKPVLRPATTAELLAAERYRLQEDEAVAACREKVRESGLPMKVIGGEYSYDGSRLTFYFAAEERVDFRNLVRDLARHFRTRIELRQIGVRDETRVVGGVGKCGRPLCCATWLDRFAPVSIRMAKQQNLPLSPNEISGLCGRLLCCLAYEYDYYKEVAGRFPRVGKVVDSPVGRAKVLHVSVLKERVDLLLEDGTRVEMSAEQFNGEAPLDEPEPDRRKTEQLADSLKRLTPAQGAGTQNGRAETAQQTVREQRSSTSEGTERNTRSRNPRPSSAEGNDGSDAAHHSSRRRRRRPRRRTSAN